MPRTTIYLKNYNSSDKVVINVHRATEPFDSESLPGEPHAVLPAGSTVYETEDVLRGESWYYLFESHHLGNDDRSYSELYHVTGLPVITGPGSQVLTAGDHRTGFYGEVPPEELITGTDLAAHFNLTAGTDQSAGVPWLKFNDHNATLFVAKQTFRHTISHNHINNANLVFGEEVIELFGHRYSVRLLTGLVDPDTYTAGGEWNRLILPVHQSDPTGKNWGINYTNADLNVGVGDGRACWMQETNPTTPANRVSRGYSSLSQLSTFSASTSVSFSGWRPVLEYVSPA